MLRFFLLLSALTFGALGLALALAFDFPSWRVALSTLAGVAGGAGIANALQQIQQLHRKANANGSG